MIKYCMKDIEANIHQISEETENMRKRIASILLHEHAFPARLDDPMEHLKTAERHLAAGHGLVILTNHPSTGDIRVPLELLFLSDIMRQKKFLMALAWHQQNYPFIKQLAKLGGVDLVPIVIQDTIEKQKELTAQGKKIPWEQHELGYGLDEYYQKMINILLHNGITLISPQSGRDTALKPFPRGVITIPDLMLRRNKIPDEQVVYLPVGLDIQGVTDYTAKKVRGLNIGRSYTIKIGEVFSSKELRENTKSNRITLEQEAWNRMARLVPSAYLPRGSIVLP